MNDSNSINNNWLLKLLQEIQLEQFYTSLKDNLQITRIEHFDFVRRNDLKDIGLSQPAIRRLLDAVKKQRKKFGSDSKYNHNVTELNEADESGLACLIKEGDLHMLSTLGQGSCGIVRKAIWMPSLVQKITVAVKVLRNEHINNPDFLQDFIKEVNSMHSLKHDNLIKLYGVVLSPLMMVTEIASLGSLLNYLRRPNSKHLILTLHKYAMQIVTGMAYLENRKFIHRDLAARNIFLSDEFTVKIGDFGLMRAIPNDSSYYISKNTMWMPYAWCAPECIKHQQYSHASDCWMMGVVLWEMFSFGQEPWVGLNGSQILNKIDKEGQTLDCPLACPSSLYSLILKCWSIQPNSRPHFSELKDLLNTEEPIVMKVLGKFEESGKLSLQEGDYITIISGKTENYWWLAQNNRTFEIGQFPRTLVEPLRKMTVEDISKPLANSLIHAGHADGSGKIWGHPGNIDEMYLENPMKPPDLLETESIKRIDKSRIVKGMNRLGRQGSLRNKQNNKPPTDSPIISLDLIKFNVEKNKINLKDKNETKLSNEKNISGALKHVFKGLKLPSKAGFYQDNRQLSENLLVDIESPKLYTNSKKVNCNNLSSSLNALHILDSSIEGQSLNLPPPIGEYYTDPFEVGMDVKALLKKQSDEGAQFGDQFSSVITDTRMNGNSSDSKHRIDTNALNSKSKFEGIFVNSKNINNRMSQSEIIVGNYKYNNSSLFDSTADSSSTKDAYSNIRELDIQHSNNRSRELSNIDPIEMYANFSEINCNKFNGNSKNINRYTKSCDKYQTNLSIIPNSNNINTSSNYNFDDNFIQTNSKTYKCDIMKESSNKKSDNSNNVKKLSNLDERFTVNLSNNSMHPLILNTDKINKSNTNITQLKTSNSKFTADKSKFNSSNVSIPIIKTVTNSYVNVDLRNKDISLTEIQKSRMVDFVSENVPCTSNTSIVKALDANKWNTNLAIKSLKIRRLYQMKLTSKDQCRKILEDTDWNLERSVVFLLDGLSKGSAV